MRTSFRTVRAFVALVFGSAAGLWAPTPSAAALYGMTGTFSITFTTSGLGLPPIETTLSQGVSGHVDLTFGAGGEIDGVSIPAGVIQPVTNTSFASASASSGGRVALQYYRYAGPGPNSAGFFGRAQGHMVGRMPVNGAVLVAVFLSNPVRVPLLVTNASLHALGLSTTAMALNNAETTNGPKPVTLSGSAWTGSTSNGPPEMNMITAMRIFDQSIGPNPIGEITGRLDMRFFQIVPEPGTALLLAPGILALGWFGRARRH
jgi:hypothetical protein